MLFYYSQLKRIIAARYFLNGSSSVFQALLKSSLVPLRDFDLILPKSGIILDLGCGEGILANLVAKLRPSCTIIGIDKDDAKLNLAKKNAEPNSKFVNGDILALDIKYKNISAIILNDVVHHQDYPFHQKLLLSALKYLKLNGVLILKEVDQRDKPDYYMTSFFDKRIYPNDKLCFRTKDEWKDLLSRLGITKLSIKKLSHPWPASRTFICAHKPRSLNDPYLIAKSIGKFNLLHAKKNTIVFITGASGFLGSHITRLLKKEGLNSKPVRLIYLTRKPPTEDKADGAPLYGDLNDLVFLQEALKGVDYVFHLAAEVKLTQGSDLWRNNYYGTISLINSLQGIKIKRLIHASTIGAIDREPHDSCSQPLDELAKPNPLTEYGKTKLLSETAIRSSKIPYSIVRITWAYGKNMTSDTHVRFLTHGAFNKKIFSFFNFPGKVSLIAATDAARAFKFIAENSKALNNTYFLSDGNPISLGDLFRAYRSVTGLVYKPIKIPNLIISILNKFRNIFPLQIQALTNNILTANPNKIFALGFSPKIKLREGLEILAFDQGHLVENKIRKIPISIVTGAASGIGKEIAVKMFKEGHNLLLIDKDIRGLRKISKETKSSFIELDLSDPKALGIIQKYIIKKNYRIDWMVNNAGIGLRGKFESHNFDEIIKLVNVNCVSVALLSNLFLKSKEIDEPGVLINIGSTAAFQPLPYMGTYAASKAFIQSITYSIIAESLNRRNIKILLVDPSGTNTNFQKTSKVKKKKGEPLLSSQFVASSIINSVYEGKSHVILGRIGKIMAFLPRILPRNTQIKLWLFLMARMR